MSLSKSRLPFLLILIYLRETINSPINDKQAAQKVVVVPTNYSQNNLQTSNQQAHSIVHSQSVQINDKNTAQKVVVVPTNYSPNNLQTSNQQAHSIVHPQLLQINDNHTAEKVVAVPTNYSPNNLQTSNQQAHSIVHPQSVQINDKHTAQKVVVVPTNYSPNSLQISSQQAHSIVHPQAVVLIDKVPANRRKQKNHNILPVTHQLLLPAQLHVIPIHSNYHHEHAAHVIRNENINLPVFSHSISHTNNGTNHSPLYLIPIHHTHLVPLHDLTVIPLQREIHTVDTKLAHYRAAMDRKGSENEEPVNRFRSFYGGYGNGLYFGGHGAGHGFYTYG